VLGVGAVGGVAHRVRVRLDPIAQVDVRQRHVAAVLGSDGRIDVIDAALGMSAVLLERVTAALV
jgi:hypothetical protein